MSPSNSSSNLEPRVSALETSVQSLTDDVRDLSRLIERSVESTRAHIERSIESTNSHLSMLSDRVSDSKRTPWGVLASWAAVVLLIVGMAGSPIFREIVRNKEQSDRTRDLLMTHLLSNGHSNTISDLDSITERVDKLEAKLDSLFYDYHQPR